MRPPIRSAAAVALVGLTLAFTSSCAKSSPTGGGGGDDFILDIRYLGTAPTGPTLVSFEAAANTVRQTITGALQVVALPGNFVNISQCQAEGEDDFDGFPDLPRDNIPGLVVYILVAPIDGPGGTLGSAGPCLIRGNEIPALGTMLLDQADVANLQVAGQLPRVVLHELMHVLGFGTVWPDLALVDTSDLADARFLGANARAACAANGGGAACATTVPVHSADGAGSQYTHWRESFFENELMTPFLNGGANPFSATSVRSLADLGYVVSNSTTESFTIDGVELRSGTSTRVPVVTFGEPTRPRWKLDATGRMAEIRRR